MQLRPKIVRANRRFFCYWSGQSTVSDNIDQGANWWGGQNPSSGDNLYFNNTAGRHWPYSNYGSGSWFGEIITYSGAGGITWRGDTTYAYKFENFNDPILFTIEPNIGNRSSPDADLELNPVGGALAVNGNVAITGGKLIKVFGTNTLTINGAIGGAGAGVALQPAFTGTVALNGANSFTGLTQVGGGTLRLGHATALGTTAGGTMVDVGATLDLHGQSIVGETLTIGGPGVANGGALVNTAAAAASWSGDVTLTAETWLGGSGNLALTGTIADGGGNFGLVKVGAGDLTLTGDNSYGGGLTIREGTVVSNKPAVFGTLVAGGITFDGPSATLRPVATVNNAPCTLIMQQTGILDVPAGVTITHVGLISGPAGFTKAGEGVFVMDGTSNTYAGTTTILGGTLRIPANPLGQDQIPDAGEVVLANAPGVLLEINGSETIGALSGGGGLGGVVDLAHGALTIAGSQSTAFGGKLMGGSQGGTPEIGKLVKSGTGTLMLTSLTNFGDNNDFAGDVIVNGGTMGIASVEALGKRGTFRNLALSDGGTLRTTNDMDFNTRVFYLDRPDADGMAGNIEVDGGTTLTIHNKITDGHFLSHPETHPWGGLRKTGSGMLVLSAGREHNNQFKASEFVYSGATVVSQGTLAVDGVIQNSPLVTVEAGARLQGEGAIIHGVNVSGVMAPGNSIESLATGSLAMLDGSTLEHEIQDTGMAGADLTVVTGDFSLSGIVTLDLMKLGTGSWSQNDKLTLLSYTGAWNNGLFTIGGAQVGDDSEFAWDNQVWLLNYNDTTKGANFAAEAVGTFVTMTVVPEPSLAILSGAAALGLALRRRRA